MKLSTYGVQTPYYHSIFPRTDLLILLRYKLKQGNWANALNNAFRTCNDQECLLEETMENFKTISEQGSLSIITHSPKSIKIIL